MPARFDFISPGILLNEIDESKIPETVNDELGPVIVGRSLTGPAMKPVRVKNLEDFNTIFGKGISGKGTQDNDVWRKGNLVGPTYAVYAAQAHLASETTPVTFVRLLGEASTDASTDAQLAGWNIADAVQRSYDVEGMHIGTVAAGRIGLDALRKMKPFDVHLHYFDRHR